MKRFECTAKRLKNDGWFVAYPINSDKPFTYEEIENAIKNGAKVEKEISTITRSVFIKIDNITMMWKPASEEEINAQRKAEENERYQRAIKNIHRRNRRRFK